jgi:hypothetical protein
MGGQGVHDLLAFAGNRERSGKVDLQGAGGQGTNFVENRGLSQPCLQPIPICAL